MSRTRSVDSLLSLPARAFLATTKAARIPGPLTPWTARYARRLTRHRVQHDLDDLVARTNIDVRSASMGGTGTVHLTPDPSTGGANGRDTLFYIHGGAFVVGTALDQLSIKLSHGTGLPLTSVDYDLSPEARYPRALEQCIAAWDALVSDGGRGRVLVGVSAGGNLSLALLATLLRRFHDGDRAALPDAVILLTPWTELDDVGDSRDTNTGRDPILRWEGQLKKAARAYRGRTDVRDPMLSPVHQDWTGLSVPVLITSGTRDLLLSDCVRLAVAMTDAGVPVTLDVAEGLWHAYQAADIPEADASIARMVRFISRIRPDHVVR